MHPKKIAGECSYNYTKELYPIANVIVSTIQSDVLFFRMHT